MGTGTSKGELEDPEKILIREGAQRMTEKLSKKGNLTKSNFTNEDLEQLSNPLALYSKYFSFLALDQKFSEEAYQILYTRLFPLLRTVNDSLSYLKTIDTRIISVKNQLNQYKIDYDLFETITQKTCGNWASLVGSEDLVKLKLKYHHALLERCIDMSFCLEFFEEAYMFKKEKNNNNKTKTVTNIDNDNNNNEEDISVEQVFLDFMKNMDEELPFKLVIHKMKQDIISHSVARVATKYGITHVALQIGCWLLDWHEGEFAQPRPFKATKKTDKLGNYTSNIIAVISFRESKVKRDRETLMNIAHIICKWNQHYTYDSLWNSAHQANAHRRGSCQAFVDDVVKALGVKPYWELRKEGLISNLLSQVKHERTAEFFPEYRGTQIKTHEDIDAVYNKYFPNEPPCDIEEYEYLRALDRAFWLQGVTTANCPLLMDLDLKLERQWESRDFNLQLEFEKNKFQVYAVDISSYDALMQNIKLNILQKFPSSNIMSYPIGLEICDSGTWSKFSDVSQLTSGVEVRVVNFKANVLHKGPEDKEKLQLDF